MIRGRSSVARSSGVPAGLVLALVVLYGLGVVYLFVSGRVVLFLAISLLVAPVVLTMGVVRPEWTILVLVALPPSLISGLPPMQLIAIALVTLFGFLVQGTLSLGPKTGIYPLVGLVALALVTKAELPVIAELAADTMLKLLIYYTLLMMAAFHAIVSGTLHIDTFVKALLVGIVGAAALQPFVSSLGFESIAVNPYRGHFAYLAVMGLGVAYVRLSLRPSSASVFDALLVLAFLILTALGFSRAVWMAGLLIFALVSRWTGKKSFWVVSSLLLLLALTVPVVGERILPGGSADFADVEALSSVTTGRSVLWGKLWELGAEGLPLGQGWGYIWSLSSVDIFGIEGEFVAGGNPFVYPHNDFLYLFVELGIVGLGLFVAYWLNLLRKARLLSRSHSESLRYGARVLLPIIVVMLIVQLFDNGFAIPAVATRFFIAAGLVLGLRYLARENVPAAVLRSRLGGQEQPVRVG